MTATPIAVREVSVGLAHEVRAVRVVWQREMIRFWSDRARMVSSLIQPLLFLFVLGTGLGSIVDAGAGGPSFRTFLFPGVLATSIAFTAAFSGISLVWDREFGFLREMLVAPVRTWSIILGKALGGATISTIQSAILVALAGLVGVPYQPVMIAELVVLMFLGAFLVTALGVVLASRVRQVQAAMPLVQLIITPMMFMSGALFPLSDLPAWLALLTRLNPFTYVVVPMRQAVLSRLDIPAEAMTRLAPGIDWFGWPVPTAVQYAVVLALCVGLLLVAVARFDRTE